MPAGATAAAPAGDAETSGADGADGADGVDGVDGVDEGADDAADAVTQHTGATVALDGKPADPVALDGLPEGLAAALLIRLEGDWALRWSSDEGCLAVTAYAVQASTRDHAVVGVTDDGAGATSPLCSDAAGGAVTWWSRTDGGWRQVHGGQDGLPCAVAAAAGVPDSLESACTDPPARQLRADACGELVRALPVNPMGADEQEVRGSLVLLETLALPATPREQALLDDATAAFARYVASQDVADLQQEVVPAMAAVDRACGTGPAPAQTS